MLFRDLSMDVILQTIAKERAIIQNQYERIADKEKDFYEDRQGLNEYLKDWGFAKEDGKTDLPLGTVNLTKKIVNKISLVYKYQPERSMADNEKDEDLVREWYQANPEFCLGYKYAERYKNLLSKILFRAHYDPDRVKWYPFIETVYEAHFLEDNTLHPIAFSYPMKQDTGTLGSVKNDWWIFWSDDLNFMYIPNTNKVDKLDNDGMNPYGIIPMIEMRDNFPVDQYESVGMLSLINANQNINIALNDLNLMIHFQAFDQPVVSGVSEDEANNIKTGPNRTVVLTDTEARMTLLGYNPKIEACIEAIKFQIQMVAYTYNLSINWSIEGNPASGFSLLVQNIDLLEAREDDVDLAILQEKQMFEVLKKMSNLHKTKPVIPEKAELAVDFQEVSFPIQQAEEIQRKEFEYKYNIRTPIDDIMSMNPDMDREQAIEKYEENKKESKQLTAADVIKERFEAAGGTIEEE